MLDARRRAASTRRFLRNVVTDLGDHVTSEIAREQLTIPLGIRRRRHTIVAAVERDGRHADLWPHGQTLLGLLDRRVSGRQREAMPVRMDDDLDEVGVVERRRRPRVRGIVEAPFRRPQPPQKLAQLVTMSLETRSPPFTVEVVLVPPRSACRPITGSP